MARKNILNNGIPIAISLNPTLEAENIKQHLPQDKKRLLTIASLAVVIAICISFIAKFLMDFLYLITHLSFYGEFSFSHVTPVANTLGLWVILIPAAGGVIAGLMALYGSKAIRGHSGGNGTDTYQPE